MRRTPRVPWRALAAGVALSGAIVASVMAARSYTAHLRTSAVEAEALREHGGGDPVAALVDYVASERHSLDDRNRAVWKLGRLGDARARQTLEALRTGQPCDHARFVCQREVEKALARLTSAR